MTTNNIATKGMLVRVSISTWSATKHDKRVTKEVADKHGASQSAGRYNKALVSKERLEEVRKLATEMRHWHYQQTLPWDDESYRILPSKNYFEYSAAARTKETVLRAAMDRFIVSYPDFRNEAKVTLNGLFDEADYPADIAEKFDIEVKVKPLPCAADFRVDIGDEAAAEIRADIERSTTAAIAAGMKDVWQRIFDAVGHMVERLNAYGEEQRDGKTVVVGAFRDSLVENIRSLCGVLPRLNLTDDPNLDRLTAEITRSLLVDPEGLRQSPTLRKKTVASAEAILKQMEEFVA